VVQHTDREITLRATSVAIGLIIPMSIFMVLSFITITIARVKPVYLMNV